MGMLDTDTEELKKQHADSDGAVTSSTSGRKVNQSGLGGGLKRLAKINSLTQKHRKVPDQVTTKYFVEQLDERGTLGNNQGTNSSPSISGSVSIGEQKGGARIPISAGDADKMGTKRSPNIFENEVSETPAIVPIGEQEVTVNIEAADLSPSEDHPIEVISEETSNNGQTIGEQIDPHLTSENLSQDQTIALDEKSVDMMEIASFPNGRSETSKLSPEVSSLTLPESNNHTSKGEQKGNMRPPNYVGTSAHRSILLGSFGSPIERKIEGGDKINWGTKGELKEPQNYQLKGAASTPIAMEKRGSDGSPIERGHSFQVDSLGYGVTPNNANGFKRITTLDISGDQRKILECIFNICLFHNSLETPNLSKLEIANQTSIHPETLKTSLKRLRKKGVLELGATKSGKGGWVRFRLPEHIYKELVYYREMLSKINTPPPVSQKRSAPEPQMTWFKELDFSAVAPITPIQVNSTIRNLVQSSLEADEVQNFINRFTPWLATQSKVSSIIGMFCDKLKEYATEQDSPVLLVKSEAEIKAEFELLQRVNELKVENALIEKAREEKAARKAAEMFEAWFSSASEEEMRELAQPNEFSPFGSEKYRLVLEARFIAKLHGT